MRSRGGPARTVELEPTSMRLSIVSQSSRVLVNAGVVVLALVATVVNARLWYAAFSNQSTEYRMGAPLVAGIFWQITFLVMVACLLAARVSVVARPLRKVMAVFTGVCLLTLVVTLVLG